MSARARLMTMAPSHYSEKARWALDLARVPYREVCYAPGLHFKPLKAVGARTVPTVVFPDGRVLKDSTDILKWVHGQHPELGLWPADDSRQTLVDALENEIDEELAPRVRDWMYSWALSDRGTVRRVFDRRLPLTGKLFLYSVAPTLGPIIRKRLKLDRLTEAEHLARLQEAWSRLDGVLSDGRRYLTGDTFTAADLAVAAIGGHIVAAPEYGGQLVAMERRPPHARELTERFRDTKTGELILRMYREHRRS